MSEAISLSDYEHLRTRMCFMDETGTLANPRDRFLGLGMVKAGHPCFATQEIQHLRDRHHFYDEVKWNKLSAKKLELFWTIAETRMIQPSILTGDSAAICGERTSILQSS